MTKIEWADTVWNPITGCTKVSDGCKNCYAERMSKRLAGRCGYSKDDPFAVTIHLKRMNMPRGWRSPRRIFVNSMGDLFHDDVPFEWLMRLWLTMQNPACHHHTFLILTKRPKRLHQFAEWLRERPAKGQVTVEFARPHIWLGVSVEDQLSAEFRLAWLLEVPSSNLFVSAEPLLAAVDLTRIVPYYIQNLPKNEFDPELWINTLEGHVHGPDDVLPRRISWVIAGGETGPGARPAHPDWFRSLRDQCQDAKVPFYFKGWGEWSPNKLPVGNQWGTLNRAGAFYPTATPWNGRTGDDSETGEVYMYRSGKKAAGRVLDGREWNEMPLQRPNQTSEG